MADFSKISNALQGFSAGVGGRLPQFRQQQMLEDQERRRAMALDMRQVIDMVDAGNTEQALTLLNNRESELLQLPGADPSTTQFLRVGLEQGRVPEVMDFLGAIDNRFVNEGLIPERAVPETVEAVTDTGKIQQDFNNKFITEEQRDSLIANKLSESDVDIAQVQSSKILPDGTVVTVMKDGATRVLSSTGSMLEGDARTDAIKAAEEFGAEIQGLRASERTEGTLTVEKELKPQIEAAITRARTEAQAQGVAFTELAQMEAAIPGLMNVVSRLKTLGETATYTTSGRAFNNVARELGFSPSEGATARAAYIATVDNEILPLLRQTFGAAFTAQEGESLKATLGDPDLSPTEKNAQLDAFIDAKRRQIETNQALVGTESEQTDLTNASDDDLLNMSTEDLLNRL